MPRSALSRGTILLATLMVFFLFVIMMAAVLRYVGRQFTAAADQEEQQEAFRVAEAGLDYTLFLLHNNIATMSSLKANGIEGEQSVNDPQTNTPAGTFTLSYSEGATTESIGVRSEGRTVSGARCETVLASIDHMGSEYLVTVWKHQLDCTH